MIVRCGRSVQRARADGFAVSWYRNNQQPWGRAGRPTTASSDRAAKNYYALERRRRFRNLALKTAPCNRRNYLLDARSDGASRRSLAVITTDAGRQGAIATRFAISVRGDPAPLATERLRNLASRFISGDPTNPVPSLERRVTPWSPPEKHLRCEFEELLVIRQLIAVPCLMRI